MAEPERGPSVLWLTPDKPDNISVGRQRIADHLEDTGFTITLRATTVETTVKSLWERGSYDVVVGTTRLGAVGGLFVSKVHGIPVIIDHIDPIRQFRKTNNLCLAAIVRHVENLAFRQADHVLYVYNEERDRVQKHATASTKTNLGVEYDRFADPDDTALQQAEAELDSVEDNIIIYIGGLEPIYSIRTLLETIHRMDEWTLLVLGTGSLESEVKEAAASRDDIIFPGTVPHDVVPGYIAQADVGISLVDDPHTLKVLEYGAADLPVVQLTGRARQRFSGMVEFCSADPTDIEDAVLRAYETDQASGLTEYVKTFDLDEVSEDYRRVIDSVLEKK